MAKPHSEKNSVQEFEEGKHVKHKAGKARR